MSRIALTDELLDLFFEEFENSWHKDNWTFERYVAFRMRQIEKETK